MAPLSLERRARKPAMCVGFERIIVAPQPELHALAEKFRLHQASVGLPAPHVAQTMAEAEQLLGLGPLVFKPVDTSWLANDKAKVSKRPATHAAFAFSACATFEAGSRPSATQISRPAVAMASRSTPCSMPRPFIR